MVSVTWTLVHGIRILCPAVCVHSYCPPFHQCFLVPSTQALPTHLLFTAPHITMHSQCYSRLMSTSRVSQQGTIAVPHALFVPLWSPVAKDTVVLGKPWTLCWKVSMSCAVSVSPLTKIPCIGVGRALQTWMPLLELRWG